MRRNRREDLLELRCAVGILAGLISVALGCLILWAFNHPISSWHWLFFPLGYCLSLIYSDWKTSALALCVLGGTLVFLFSWSMLCQYFLGLNWDGMLTHKEYVMSLAKGWNPVTDPYYAQPIGRNEWESYNSFRMIEWGGFNIRFGYIYQAVIAKALNSVESGKSVNLLYFLLPFLISRHVVRFFSDSAWVQWILPLVVALNPVAILQTISFWEDIQFAALSTSVILLGMLICKRFRTVELIALLGCIFLIVGVKRSGIAFSGVFTISMAFIYFLNRPFSRKHLLVTGVLLLIFPLMFLVGSVLGIWKSHGLLPHHLEQILTINNMEHFFPEEMLQKIPKMANLDGLFLFMGTVLSEGSMQVQDLSIKFPFLLTRDEILLYLNVFSAPWFGGFGPFYGSVLLLSATALFLRFVAGQCSIMENRNIWLWIGFLLGILWLMPPFFPRWIPFMWLLPVLMFLLIEGEGKDVYRCLHATAFDLRPGSSFWHHAGWISIILMLINSCLIVSLNLAGHIRLSGVVHEQLEFIDCYVEKPIRIYFKDFVTNRDWLDSKGIAWKVLDESETKSTSMMYLGRTNTAISLEGVDLDKPFVINGKRWESVEAWGIELNRRLGRRNEWDAWIKPSIVLNSTNPVAEY